MIRKIWQFLWYSKYLSKIKDLCIASRDKYCRWENLNIKFSPTPWWPMISLSWCGSSNRLRFLTQHQCHCFISNIKLLNIIYSSWALTLVLRSTNRCEWFWWGKISILQFPGSTVCQSNYGARGYKPSNWNVTTCRAQYSTYQLKVT